MAYPTTLDTFPAAATLATHDLDTDPHSGLHGNLGVAVAALEAKVGVNSSAVTSSVDYIITNNVLLKAGNLSGLANAATARTNLGLGTIATQDANNVTITGGSITGITDLAVADGGTGASTAATARTNLGLIIGTDVQAFDSDLNTIAGLTATTDNFMQAKSSAWASRTVAQVLVDLAAPSGGVLIKSNNLSELSSTGGTARYNIHDQVLATADVVATANIASLANTGSVQDGVTLAAGDIVLATAQSTGSQNGPWTVVSGGNWTRPTDYPNAGTVRSRLIQVRRGTTYAQSIWGMSLNTSVIVDTDSSTWSQMAPKGGTALSTLPGYQALLASNAGSAVGAGTTKTTICSGTLYTIPAAGSGGLAPLVGDIYRITAWGTYVNNSSGSAVSDWQIDPFIGGNSYAGLATNTAGTQTSHDATARSWKMISEFRINVLNGAASVIGHTSWMWLSNINLGLNGTLIGAAANDAQQFSSMLCGAAIVDTSGTLALDVRVKTYTATATQTTTPSAIIVEKINAP